MIKLEHNPRLKKPNLVVGWNDAGYVGMKALNYLRTKLGALSLGEIEPVLFFPLPDVIIKEGVLETLQYPGNRFWYWRGKKTTSDLILFAGNQPVEEHSELVNLILDVAEKFGVNRIYTVGAFDAKVAHTEPAKVLAVVNFRELKQLLRNYELETNSNYHGPTSMNSLLLALAKERGMGAIGLWGQVPYYIAEIPNPGISLALLRVLCQMLRLTIDFTELEAEADYAQKEVDKLIDHVRQQSPDFDQFLERLETGTLTKDEGKKFFKEIEDFLKKHRE